MQIHDRDVSPGAEPRPAVAQRREDAAASEHAARALVAGQLDASALLHLQRATGNANVSSLLTEEREEPSPVREVISSKGGRPLNPNIRAVMEERLGADFGDVRVHTGAKATASARSVSAQAYTVGNEVVFQGDRYAPETEPGQRMLAHELTHVMQQRAGPVAGTPAPGGINISHPSDSFEQAAERAAERAMAEAPTSAPAGAAAQVQRQEEEEEETAQTFVQRQEEEEEEEPAPA